MLEYSRNARNKMLGNNKNTRKQCWNTVEMHANKQLEYNRNARKQFENKKKDFTGKHCWNTVEMHAKRNAGTQ